MVKRYHFVGGGVLDAPHNDRTGCGKQCIGAGFYPVPVIPNQ